MRRNGRDRDDKHRNIHHAACRLARHCCRLVLGSASVQECLLGQGHDVDLPPQRHLHLQLFSAVLHDGADVHDRAVAQPQRTLPPHYRTQETPTHPDPYHHFHPPPPPPAAG